MLVGDVHPVDVAEVAGAYTPVPGGVGPLTIAMLMVEYGGFRRTPRSRRMLKVGLTGGLACGKIFVGEALAELGLPADSRRRTGARGAGARRRGLRRRGAGIRPRRF